MDVSHWPRGIPQRFVLSHHQRWPHGGAVQRPYAIFLCLQGRDGGRWGERSEGWRRSRPVRRRVGGGRFSAPSAWHWQCDLLQRLCRIYEECL